MAAFSPTQVGSRSLLFNGRGSSEQDLPGGSCNYRDLSIGTRAPVCGCQRFYLNGTHQGHEAGFDRAWCFCGHHACFHNAFSQQQGIQERGVSASRTGWQQEQDDIHEPSNAQVEIAPQTRSSFAKGPTGLGIRAGSRSQSQSINTRVWQALNDFARNQDDGGVSDTTSKLPSTAAPSVIEDVPPSPTPAVTHQIQPYRSMGPPVNIPQTFLPRPNEDYSATEVATPSIAGTPDFRALAASSNQPRTSPEQLKSDRPQSEVHTADGHVHVDAMQRMQPATIQDPTIAASDSANSLQDLHNMMRTYGQRLEVLESLSFSNVPLDEIQERFELFDGRILDLEQWRIEQDQQRTSPQAPESSNSKRRRLLPDETASFASDASFDSNAAAQTEAVVLATLAANAETHPRIDALENRVISLESAALPSYTRPWQVEIVLLPWSPELRGIWFSSSEATQHSLRSGTQISEEWNGDEAAPTLSFKSTENGAWTTESIEAWANEAQEWLSPKACGPSGSVFQRLASCGLVQTVTFTASDARHILNEITDAFGNIWTHRAEIVPDKVASFQGLSEPFVPLRKVRKSSRLRFLSSAELITSASWTADFLDASVFMKTNTGQKRLYLTTPDAYIQPTGGDALNWTHIRELPSHSPSREQLLAPHNSVREACWTYHENLDHPFSVHSSFGSRESQWSTRSQLADKEDQANVLAPMSPSSEGRVQHNRTVSLPSSISTTDKVRNPLPQRRVASFGPAVMKHHYEPEISGESASKRRRISLSPEAERRGVNFTPRWSREPPSPFTSEAAVESKSQSAGSRRRGTTPFAYATPHSHSNYVGRMDFVPGDGDTEVDTDVLGASSDHGEEEWEGVDDNHTDLDGDGSENEGLIDEDDRDA